MFSFFKWWATPGRQTIQAEGTSIHQGKDGIAAGIIIQKIIYLHEKLAAKQDLRPCTQVNDLFGELVDLCTRTVNCNITRTVLASPLIEEILPSLRTICSVAESHLEAHWASLITGSLLTTEESTSIHDRLALFPYYCNYVDLTRMELSAITSIIDSPIRSIAFIGSGPLPLTSLCITLQHITSAFPPTLNTTSQTTTTIPPISILNIDSSTDAITQSSALCRRLGVGASTMRFLHADAREVGDLTAFDVVYVAALVGSGQGEKEEVLRRVVGEMRVGAVVVVRSAERLRRLLYAEFDPTTDRVTEVLDVQMLVHPYNHVVNSVILGKVKKRGGEVRV